MMKPNSPSEPTTRRGSRLYLEKGAPIALSLMTMMMTMTMIMMMIMMMIVRIVKTAIWISLDAFSIRTPH